MASRGSGIGAGIRGSLSLNTNALGSGAKSASPGSVYGGPVTGSVAQLHTTLWVLVLVELALLIGLRHAFRNHHGG